MSSNRSGAVREAKHGEKMIEVKVRFWTDNLAGNGKVVRKNAWTAGVVRMKSNAPHGIKPAGAIPFNSLFDLGIAIEKALTAHGVVLHANRRMRKYLTLERPLRGASTRSRSRVRR